MTEIYNILEKVEEIDISGNMCLKCLRAEQNKLIAIDNELRNLRKNSVYRITRNKCTEVLQGINYAVSIYLPKERKIGISLVKEAVEYLKVQAELLKLWKDPEEERESYKEQRNELFTEIKNLEIERFRANREIENECKPARHNELIDEIQEIELKTDKVFERLGKLNLWFKVTAKVLKQNDLSYKQVELTVMKFETFATAIEV